MDGMFIFTVIIYSSWIGGYVIVRFKKKINYWHYYYYLNEVCVLVVYGDILIVKIRLKFGWIHLFTCIDTNMKHGGIFYFFCYFQLFYYYFYVVALRLVSDLSLILYYFLTTMVEGLITIDLSIIEFVVKCLNIGVVSIYVYCSIT